MTFAPNFAANIPGNAVPQPISKIRLPLNLSRCIHRNLNEIDPMQIAWNDIFTFNLRKLIKNFNSNAYQASTDEAGQL